MILKEMAHTETIRLNEILLALVKAARNTKTVVKKANEQSIYLKKLIFKIAF